MVFQVSVYALRWRKYGSLCLFFQPEGCNTLPVRQGATLDKDKSTFIAKEKSMMMTCNGDAPLNDKLHGLPVGGEGWDKKMKRKRSIGTMVNKTPDGDRELKQATQQRHGYGPHP